MAVLHGGELVECGAPGSVLSPGLLSEVFGIDAEIAISSNGVTALECRGTIKDWRYREDITG